MGNEYLTITEEDIEINFYIDGEEYIVLKNPNENLEEVYIAKIIRIDGKNETIVSVTDEEYERALDEYISILENEVGDESYED